MIKKVLFHLLHPLWQIVDFLTPKRADHWAFATHHLHAERFIENQRAVFEHLKADHTVRKIIFYRGTPPDFQICGAINYEVVRHGSLRGFFLLVRCKVVFLTHSVSMDYSLRRQGGRFSVLKLSMRNRVVVNLWHGIPLKRLLYTANEATFRHTDRVKYRTQERRNYAGLIASSDIDSYSMSAMFYPLNYRQVWITGLPRNDFLAEDEQRLPQYISDSLVRIRSMKNGRKLVLYAPTYRQTGVSNTANYYQFSDVEIEHLRRFLRANDAVFGYRPHYFRNSEHYFNLDSYIDGDLIIDVSQSTIHEFSALARECDILVTDYSSVYIDAVFLNKPVICFGYDIDHYKTQEDGLLYDMDLAFPGPVVRSFNDLIAAMEDRLNADQSAVIHEQAVTRRLFFKYQDAMNSRRVVQRVRQTLSDS